KIQPKRAKANIWGIGDYISLQRLIKLSQVFINLFKNAIQANQGKDDNWVKVSTSNDGAYVSVVVSDVGSGIPKEIADKIFTETFTTKSFDQGTGLGLNICRSIVEDHGGVLMLDTEAANTTFIVKLPIS
ncbi:MAG: GHKL domain-containing protein, partial [Oligoflexales bacterium]|nr:GHKL domain-containing protein [Oligoflexales bacterium]